MAKYFVFVVLELQNLREHWERMKEKYWGDWDEKLYKEPEKPLKKEKPKEDKKEEEEEATNGGKKEEDEEKKDEKEEKKEGQEEDKKEDEDKKEWGECTGSVEINLKSKSWWYCADFGAHCIVHAHADCDPRPLNLSIILKQYGYDMNIALPYSITKESDQNTHKYSK